MTLLILTLSLTGCIDQGDNDNEVYDIEKNGELATDMPGEYLTLHQICIKDNKIMCSVSIEYNQVMMMSIATSMGILDPFHL